MADISETVDLDFNINFSKNAEKELQTNLEKLVDKGMSLGMAEAMDKMEKEAKKYKDSFKGVQILANNQTFFDQFKEFEKAYKKVQGSLSKEEKARHDEYFQNARKKMNQNAKITQEALKNLRLEKRENIEAERQKELMQNRTAKVEQTFGTFRTEGLGGLLSSTVKSLSPNAIFGKAYDSFNKRANKYNEDINAQQQKLKDMKNSGMDESDEAYQVEKEHLKQLQKDKGKYSKAANIAGALQGTVNTFTKLAKSAFQALGMDITSIMSSVGQTIKDVLSETGIASYDTANSLFTNASAREQQMKYGLSSESNYALTKTMSMLGMKNDDDLMYMNENQKQAFNDIMEKYKTWYSQLESTGAMEKIQQAQLDFKMFKEELSYKFLGWFAEHKDQIFTAIEFIMNVVFKIAEVVMNILNALPFTKGMTSSLTSSDSSLTNNYSNKNVSINVNTTNNATANLQNKSEMDNFFSGAEATTVRSIAQAIESM